MIAIVWWVASPSTCFDSPFSAAWHCHYTDLKHRGKLSQWSVSFVLKPNAVKDDDSEPDETTGNTANTDNDTDEQRKDNNYIDIT